MLKRIKIDVADRSAEDVLIPLLESANIESALVFDNGLLMSEGSDDDYVIEGNSIRMLKTSHSIYGNDSTVTIVYEIL